MAKQVAINGFGRIGRLVFRQLMELQETVEVAAINDIAPLDNLVYLLKYDSVHADPKGIEIKAADGFLHWGDKKIKFMSVRNPDELPWGEMDVDIAIEATGIFTKREDAAKHLQAGANRVVVTAPSKGAELTVCMGVNEDEYNPEEHEVISNASCTTNCLASVAKVLDEEFGIVNGLLTTVHAYTSSQQIVDAPSKKMRRGRAGAANIVPTTTGAAIATTQVLPQLKGKMDGMAIRVPVPNGSIIDFVARTEKPVSVESVNEAFRRASQTERMMGILGFTMDEIVSSDIIGSEYSALVDGESTMVIGDNTVKVLAWYDNEWGYAKRVVDLTVYISEQS